MAPISKSVSEYLESEIARGVFPGAQYVIGENGEIVSEDALGWAVVEPELVATSADTIYDLASLTKPLVTSLLIVKLAERGLLNLYAPVADYLNKFCDQPGADDKRRIRLIDLLTHTSGLPSWRPLYLESESTDSILSVIGRAPLAGEAGSAPVLYSDLNYILLGRVIERVAADRLDKIARREIFEPLKLSRTMFNPPPELKRQTAATERGQSYELETIVEITETLGRENKRASEFILRAASDQDDDPVSLSPRLPIATSGTSEADGSAFFHPLRRTEVIWGEVHDGNAYYLGGVAGHAGLFSTAREVFCMANQFLPGSRLVGGQSLKLFGENFTEGRGDARSVGWILAETPDCSAGPLLPPTAFGHTGFTGTSVWLDPDSRRVFVLLTNRIHPKVGTIAMKGPRQRFHSLAVEALERKSRTLSE